MTTTGPSAQSHCIHSPGSRIRSWSAGYASAASGAGLTHGPARGARDAVRRRAGVTVMARALIVGAEIGYSQRDGGAPDGLPA